MNEKFFKVFTWKSLLMISNEEKVKDPMDTLFMFVLQVAKKYLLTR